MLNFFWQILTYRFLWIAANKGENFGDCGNKRFVFSCVCLIYDSDSVFLLNVGSPSLQPTYIMYAFLNR